MKVNKKILLSDHRTGIYTIKELALMHDCSKAYVHRIINEAKKLPDLQPDEQDSEAMAMLKRETKIAAERLAADHAYNSEAIARRKRVASQIYAGIERAVNKIVASLENTDDIRDLKTAIEALDKAGVTAGIFPRFNASAVDEGKSQSPTITIIEATKENIAEPVSEDEVISELEALNGD